LIFHPEKCAVMHLGKTNTKYNYFLNGQQLGKTSTEKDLGVIVDDNLTLFIGKLWDIFFPPFLPLFLIFCALCTHARVFRVYIRRFKN